MARDDHDLRERRELQDLSQRREAFRDAAIVGGQAQVLQHDGGLMPAQLVDGGLAVGGRDDLVILEAPAELALDSGIVFYDQ